MHEESSINDGGSFKHGGGYNIDGVMRVFDYILSSMLKGIAPQLKVISNYLQGQVGSEPAWEAYLINVQNNTLDLLKLASMVFNQIQPHLPRDLPSAFDRTVSALRTYLHNRPHGEPEEEHEAVEEDEVTRFLENKPQIDTKDQERGELFKFLAMNEQKQRNTQMMLQFAPRYSANHPLPHLPILPRTSCFRNDRQQRTSEGQGGDGREIIVERTVAHGTSLRESQRLKRERHIQIQTELSLLNCMQKVNFQGESGQLKQYNDVGTEMSDFTIKMRAVTIQDAQKQGSQSTTQMNVPNESIGVHEKDQKQKISQQDTSKTKQKSSRTESKEGRGSVAQSNKQIAKQEEKSKPKTKKNDQKRQSNSLSSTKKDLLKGGRKQSRKSKELNQGKDTPGKTNVSKFGKENKGLSTLGPFETIRETPQDLAASVQYCPTPQYGQNDARLDREEETVCPKSTFQTITTEHGHSLEKENDGVQVGDRDKSTSDNHHKSCFQGVTEQAFSSTATMSFYHKQSKTEDKHSSLPKIEQRSKPSNDRAQSLRRKIYESSPYLNSSLHYGMKQPKLHNNNGMMTNSRMYFNQHAHRSLHLDSSCGQSQREGLLREEESRMVREIQELGARPAQQQWNRILRGIRHYQLMHATLCGENCVHLNKFYQFLRRRKLAGCLNRRLLLPHKKNIEIGTTL